MRFGTRTKATRKLVPAMVNTELWVEALAKKMPGITDGPQKPQADNTSTSFNPFDWLPPKSA